MVLLAQDRGLFWAADYLLLVLRRFVCEPGFQKCAGDLADRLVLPGRLNLDRQMELAGDSDGDTFLPFHLPLPPVHYAQPFTQYIVPYFVWDVNFESKSAASFCAGL